MSDLARKEGDTCLWKQKEVGSDEWATTCHSRIFLTQAPGGAMRFCCYCGKRLVRESRD